MCKGPVVGGTTTCQGKPTLLESREHGLRWGMRGRATPSRTSGPHKDAVVHPKCHEETLKVSGTRPPKPMPFH